MKIDPVKKAPVPAISGEDLLASPQKARSMLMLLLQSGAKGHATLQAAFSR